MKEKLKNLFKYKTPNEFCEYKLKIFFERPSVNLLWRKMFPNYSSLNNTVINLTLSEIIDDIVVTSQVPFMAFRSRR